MSLFTPIQGFIGGSLIGGSASVLLVLNGTIMGASGILSNTILNPFEQLKDPTNRWRYTYWASFAMTVNLFVNYLAPPSFMADNRSLDVDVPVSSTLAYLLGGFLVGAGTRIGNGCTTGHGICGLARMSKRSLVATCTFTGVSMLTTFLTSPLRSWASVTSFLRTTSAPAGSMSPAASGLFMAACVVAAMIAPALSAHRLTTKLEKAAAENEDRKTLGASLSGAMFAAGLAISGMAKASKVHDFLCISGMSHGSYDPTLMVVMGSGILSSWLGYQYVNGWSMIRPPEKTLSCPAALSGGACFAVPTSSVINAELLTGNALFGVGWGLTGICPGPAVFAAAAGNLNAIFLWMPGFAVGSYVGLKIKESLFAPKVKTA